MLSSQTWRRKLTINARSTIPSCVEGSIFFRLPCKVTDTSNNTICNSWVIFASNYCPS